MIDRAPERSHPHAGEPPPVGALAMSSRREGDEHLIALAGEFDLAHVDEVQRELERVEASGVARIVVDLSQLSFIDSSGVRVLVMAGARSRARAGRLRLVRGPAGVHRVFAMCGLDGIVPFAE